MRPAFYYVVRKNLIVIHGKSGPQFIEDESLFEDESPIVARQAAFRYLQNYIEVLLQDLGKSYISDIQARDDLKHFTQYEFADSNTPNNKSEKFFGGIGIFLIQSEKPNLPDWDYYLRDGLSNIVYSIGRLGEVGFSMEDDYDNYYFIECLDAEFKLYKYFNYDTRNHAEVIEYFGPPVGYPIGDAELFQYEVLKTPFDWTEYGRLMEARLQFQDDELQEEVKASDETKEKFIENLIEGGENETVEFKPCLYYDFKNQSPSVWIKSICAKAICAFLNKRGGHLLIGVNDRKEIIGLGSDYKLFPEGKRNQSDRFRLEFDNLINQFFDKSIRSRLQCDIVVMANGKEVFCVEVMEAKKPVFLKGEKGKEFYVRGAASSQPLTDIEEITKYCLDKWGGNFKNE